MLLQAFAVGLGDRPAAAVSSCAKRSNLAVASPILWATVADAPDFDHGVDALLDKVERPHDLGGALAGDVLERAGRIDVDRALIELFAERGREALLPQRPGDLLNVLRGRQDFRGGFLGRFDDLVELFGGTGQLLVELPGAA